VAFCRSSATMAPLAREPELYLTCLHRGGTGLGNLKLIGAYLLRIVRFLRLETARDVAQDEVLRAAGFVSRTDFCLACQHHDPFPSSSTNSTLRIFLCGDTRAATNVSTSSTMSGLRKTENASATSPASSSGLGTTATSAIKGCNSWTLVRTSAQLFGTSSSPVGVLLPRARSRPPVRNRKIFSARTGLLALDRGTAANNQECQVILQRARVSEIENCSKQREQGFTCTRAGDSSGCGR
jgi:hypothetical protein